MRFNHQVHDGYEKGMALSSDVNDTDEDTDEDESNNSIVHDPFDEPDYDKVSSTMLHYNSLTSIIRFSDEGLSKGLCTMELFDLSSSVSSFVSLTSDDRAIPFS